MVVAPDFAEAARLIGDPARARMLTALIDGKACTATELALLAGVSPSTATVHLARMVEGGLIGDTRQGRRRYFRLSGPDVKTAIEALMVLAQRTTPSKQVTEPRDASLRHARSCYGHLAGTAGVALFQMLTNRGWIRNDGRGWRFDPESRRAFGDWAGFDARALTETGRSCLDWGDRREHLGGTLGKDLLKLLVDHKICTVPTGRSIIVNPGFSDAMSASA